MSTPQTKPNLMQADQARKQALLEKRRKKLSPIIFIIPGILLFFACISFLAYQVLDLNLQREKEKQLNEAIEEFKNQPVPPPSVTEGRKFHFIWKCELYKYDIDLEKSTLISANVSGYKDLPCIENTLFTENEKIIPAYDESESITGIYHFNFDSADILTNLGISSGAGENAFDINTEEDIAYQFILNSNVYKVNLVTKEVDKLFEAGGFAPAETPENPTFGIKLSPDKKVLIIEDSISQSTDPFDLEIEVNPATYYSVRVVGIDGKVIDQFQGKYAHWLDDNRIAYWPYKKGTPKVTIRNIKTKTEVEILSSINGVIGLDTEIKESLITLTRQVISDDNIIVESYLYENSTGIDTKLSKGYLGIQFLPDNLLVGFSSKLTNEEPSSLEPSGIWIHNIDKNESKLIIGE